MKLRLYFLSKSGPIFFTILFTFFFFSSFSRLTYVKITYIDSHKFGVQFNIHMLDAKSGFKFALNFRYKSDPHLKANKLSSKIFQMNKGNMKKQQQ